MDGTLPVHDNLLIPFQLISEVSKPFLTIKKTATAHYMPSWTIFHKNSGVTYDGTGHSHQ